VDADILDPDTAPGNIVMGRTVEEGDTAMARIVREGDIDRHGLGQVAEGRKSADMGRKPGHPDCSTGCL
jgi:hypothetical protein